MSDYYDGYRWSPGACYKNEYRSEWWLPSTRIEFYRHIGWVRTDANRREDKAFEERVKKGEVCACCNRDFDKEVTDE